MTEEPWSRFLEYAAHARTKPAFDAEERRWKLDVADRLSAALARAGSDSSWVDAAVEAVKRPGPPFLTSNGQRRWLRAWAASGDESLHRAIAAVIDRSLDPVERLAQFVREGERFEPEDGLWRLPIEQVRASSLLALGSVFNFAAEPETVPIVRSPVFRQLRQLLGIAPDGGGEEPVSDYRAHLELAYEVRARLENHGVPIRDMVDVQSLISIGVEEAALWTSDPPPGWVELGRRALPKGAAYLTVCALYRNEAPYLREWIEFHRIAGVERFYLYDNGSTDEHLDLLAPYVERGIVERREWSGLPPDQGEVYSDCLRRHREDARWIAFIDVDEFLFSPTERPLDEVMREYEEHPGVAVNMATFSYSGHRTPPSGLVIENYTLMDTTEYVPVKQIVDPLRTIHCENVHWFVFEYGLPVDENGWPIGAGRTKARSYERLRINHYPSKSEREAREKIERAPSWTHLARWRLSDLRGELELVPDETIASWAPRLKAVLASTRTA